MLNAISAAPDGSVWAAGTETRATGSRGLVYELVGSKWVRMRIPNHISELTSIHAASSTDVWAGGRSPTRPVVMHFNGLTWATVETPLRRTAEVTGVTGTSDAPFAAVNTIPLEQSSLDELTPTGWVDRLSTCCAPLSLNGISESSASDVWAVGDWASATGGTMHPLVFHYDGVTASRGRLKTPSGTDHVLNAVADLSPTSVWAVGYGVTAHGVSHKATMVETWNGTSWTHPASPSLPTGDSVLNAITGVPGGSATELWTVGEGDGQPLILHQP